MYEKYINHTWTAQTVDVNVSGVKLLRLETDMGANNAQDHTDWADAKLFFMPEMPELILTGSTVNVIHAPEGSELIVAVYKNDMLVDVSMTAADHVDEVSVSGLLDKGDRVSVYLWDTKKMIPLTKALEVK